MRPGALKNEVIGMQEGRLKIKIKAPPNDGGENKEILEFLFQKLKIP
jgi:uncharacterized protein (TIGR00251 family)